MSDELIKVTEDEGIVTITLNRPERLNAFAGHMRRDLAEALEEAGSDPHVRVVVITGGGRAFCAGAASGAGFNLALACDLRIASNTATFSQSFVKLGFHPDWGGTYFLPRMVPSNIACELFFLGDAIDAQMALDLGLLNRVVAPD